MTDRLRVLIDGSPLKDMRRTAGIGRYAGCLIAALEELGEAEILVAEPRRPPFREQWPVRFLNAQPAAVAGLRHRPAVVHSLASDPVIGFPLSRQVATVHDVVPWTMPEGALRRPVRWYLELQRRRLRRCGALITVSQSVKTDVVSTFGIDPGRVTVIANGVSSTFSAEAGISDGDIRAAAGISAGGYVLWVGSLNAHDPRKALDDLLEAVDSLADERLPLVMVGRGGPESTRLRSEARRRGIDLVLPGFVEDEALAAIYRGATLAAVPSRHEGFGIPALEAMASGTPLVASRGGNLGDLVGDAGVLVDPGDTAGLSRALRQVIADDRLRARLSAAGPQRAAAYSWRRTAEETMEVYRRAARARR